MNRGERSQHSISKGKKEKRRYDDRTDDEQSKISDDSEERRQRRRKKRRKRQKDDRKRHKKRSKKRKYSSSGSDVSSGSESDDSKERSSSQKSTKKVVNQRLLQKLAEKGETLEEREERRAKRRADRIAAKFDYTPENNPFNDPNLHETFSWKKKEEKQQQQNDNEAPTSHTSKRDKLRHTFDEIEKVRKRRKDRELQMEEMERIRAEESRMRELENYDEWARKEEEFHLQQQRQRSAIRLVEGREKPVDVLAKNLLLFGLTEEEKKNRAAVKYQERYNALDELETLEAELDEPHVFLQNLKLRELEELVTDIDAFVTLEREAMKAAAQERGEVFYPESDTLNNPVLRYWDDLRIVTNDEIQFLRTGGSGGSHATVVEDIKKLFHGQSSSALIKMKAEVQAKLGIMSEGDFASSETTKFDRGGVVDTDYWQTVLDQLVVHLAKLDLSSLHNRMLVRQLEKLEKKREALSSTNLTADGEANVKDGSQTTEAATSNTEADVSKTAVSVLPKGVEADFGNLEEELGLSHEVDLGNHNSYAWQDKYRPRKPRYFNRVKTGYDWNKYNQTHYDHDNPPPKTVQGYKFNMFYPDLIDKTQTPQYFLEPADTENFCILRFRAGPPYEDVAFKIINREWNRSRRRGFRCTFERGVLSLYFNFSSHWYRR